jgi:sulfur carrier protein
MIKVIINGEPRHLASPSRLADLVAIEAGEDSKGVAVGLNRRVIPRPKWRLIKVAEGDEVEIIAPFAGG